MVLVTPPFVFYIVSETDVLFEHINLRGTWWLSQPVTPKVNRHEPKLEYYDSRILNIAPTLTTQKTMKQELKHFTTKN